MEEHIKNAPISKQLRKENISRLKFHVYRKKETKKITLQPLEQRYRWMKLQHSYWTGKLTFLKTPMLQVPISCIHHIWVIEKWSTVSSYVVCVSQSKYPLLGTWSWRQTIGESLRCDCDFLNITEIEVTLTIRLKQCRSQMTFKF